MKENALWGAGKTRLAVAPCFLSLCYAKLISFFLWLRITQTVGERIFTSLLKRKNRYEHFPKGVYLISVFGVKTNISSAQLSRLYIKFEKKKKVSTAHMTADDRAENCKPFDTFSQHTLWVGCVLAAEPGVGHISHQTTPWPSEDARGSTFPQPRWAAVMD